ncbi:MAG TPA: hypothetical protein VF532_08710 [Candidatus Angelobacter sp.]
MISDGFWGWQRRSAKRLLVIASLLPVVLSCGVLAAVSQGFFPGGAFYPDNLKLDAFKAKWYSEQLTALEEPPLFKAKQDPGVQSYRFLWLRTFHHPVAVRVVIHPDGAGTVTAKMADGAGGYKPGKLLVDKTELLPPNKVKKLIEKIAQLSYWALPTRDPEPPGLDGAQWVVEGIDHGKYHLVDRWTPKKGAVRELGLYFLRDVASLDLKNEPIY